MKSKYSVASIAFCATMIGLSLTAAAQEITPAPWFPGNYRVVFESNNGGDVRYSCFMELYTANADRTDHQILTINDDYDGQASWSPDGNHIVFVTDRDEDYEIYTMDASGANVRRLTRSDGIDEGPQWSPDGTEIVFTSWRTGDTDIYLMNADGSNVRNLTAHSARDENPNWSPDGSQIAFSSSRNEISAIYVMDRDGSNVELLLEVSDKFIWGPVWSPDGTKLAYNSVVTGDLFADLHILDLVTGQSIQIPRGDHGEGLYSPAWSPDGEILSYTTFENGPQTMFYQLRTGTVAQFSWFPYSSNTNLAWSPVSLGTPPTTRPPTPVVTYTVYERDPRTPYATPSCPGW